jgi:hypothetical protein
MSDNRNINACSLGQSYYIAANATEKGMVELPLFGHFLALEIE